MNIITKICMNSNCEFCGIEQDISNFYKNKSTKDGYQFYCKKCITILRKETYKQKKNNILQYKKNYYNDNKNDILQYKKDYGKQLAKLYFINKIRKYEECRQDPNNLDLLQVKCFNSNCKQWFNPTNIQIKNRLGSINGTTNGENHFYCSDDCKTTCSIYRKKTKNEISKGHVCNHSDILQVELRNLVFELDNFTCQMCNQSKSDNKNLILHCHHIIPLAYELMFASDVDNCITLCDKCHKKIHKLPGCQLHELKKEAKIRRKNI